LQNTSFFQPNCQFFIGFFILLCLLNRESGKWFQPLHKWVTFRLRPPVRSLHRVSSDSRVKGFLRLCPHALDVFLTSQLIINRLKKKLPLISIELIGLPFRRIDLQVRVKFQRAALSSLIQNTIFVKIKKPPSPYNPHMGLAVHTQSALRFPFFLNYFF